MEKIINVAQYIYILFHEDAGKVRPYDHVWDMYCDEFEDAESAV